LPSVHILAFIYPFTITVMAMMQRILSPVFSAVYLCYLYAVYFPLYIFILFYHVAHSQLKFSHVHASITCISVHQSTVASYCNVSKEE